ncbi:hypothetical protein CTEN210_09527 [Chaetoceros tenuissimus]|uniref:MYND-type domain-containing protein n=1 Tax=Chaetoceros tenuissimus TaxID=426638 RepID=A0AAD3CVL8_9STRA|nr:hypothetical protein CTEN210_09527 [Chaetoceros tenuissimus]
MPVKKYFNMKVLHTLEFDLKDSDPQDGATASEPPLALGNLNGEDSEHMYLLDPNADYESRHGRFKNYYGQYIGDRSSKMPVHKKLKGLSKKGYSKNVMSPVATKLLNRLVNGKFKVSLTIGETPDVFGTVQPILYFVISTDVELDSDSDPEYATESCDKVFKDISLPPPKKNDVCALMFVGDLIGMKICQSRELSHILDSKIQSIVETHALHLTVRHCGLSIAKVSVHAFNVLSHRVLQSWQQLEGPPANSKYSLVLDSMITIMDTTMLIEGKNSDSNSLLLCRLGEVLEVIGRYNDAAWLYLDRASRVDHWREEKGMAYNAAGLAFKYAGQLDKSEFCYIKAWGLTASSGPELPERFRVVLENLNKLYVGCGGENLSRYHFTRSDMDGFDMIIETLMDTSGYYRFGDGHITILNIDKSNLKEHLRSPIVARKFLQNLPTKTPKEFRQALRDCWLDGSTFVIVGNEGSKKTGKEHSECMLELVTESFDKVPKFFEDRKCEACGQLESETNKLLKCPCLAVRYCSKVCQKAHFKTHKKHCAYVLKSNKGKK